MTFGLKVPKLNSRPVYCLQIYGSCKNSFYWRHLKFRCSWRFLGVYLFWISGSLLDISGKKMELTRYHGSLNLESFGSLFVIQRRKKHLPRLSRSASEHKHFSLSNSQQSLSLGPDKFSVFQLKKQTSQKKKKMCYPSSCLHVTCLLHKSYRLTNCLQAKWLHRFCIHFLLKKPM